MNAVNLIGSKGGIVRFNPTSNYPRIVHLFDNVFKAVNFCNFTTRVSGELTKNYHISPLKYLNSPLKFANRTKIYQTCFTGITAYYSDEIT